MSLIVIGGHSRNIGKTSVVAGLISALREFRWTALKITQYGHEICARDGASCNCATGDHTWAVTQELDGSGKGDTCRFLAAGAEKVWWVRTQEGRLVEAMPAIRRILADAGNAIVESNSVMKFVKPDLYVTVLDPATADFKESAREFLDRADAAILHGTEVSSWKNISLKPLAGRPQFRIHPPGYVTPEIVEFVKGRLAGNIPAL